MKVLHILNELKPSGAETMLLSAAPQWLAESGQHILSTGSVEGSFAGVLKEAGYRIHHLPFAKTRGFFHDLADLCEREGFDVVHLHTERASLWYAWVIRRRMRARVRLVRTVHHLFRFDGLFRLRRKFERQFMRRVLGVVFLSNSPSGRRNELRRFGMDNALAPNWYDSRRFRPPGDDARRAARRALGYADGQTVFVSLGGNWSYKNYDRIVRALKDVAPGRDLKYVQIGPAGEPLEDLAAELGVGGRFERAGIVDDALPYLHAADVYLMPSSEEGFGVAAVEAMACGLPAVLADVEALCDFRGPVRGIRYLRAAEDDLARAMGEMVALPEQERRALGAMQAADVERHYGLGRGPLDYLKAWRGEEVAEERTDGR